MSAAEQLELYEQTEIHWPSPKPLVAALVQHSSASNEHYTPAWLAKAAREVMGGIGFDPASCALGNEVVKAEIYCSAEPGLGGLDIPAWFGNVFLNPPGGYITSDGSTAPKGTTAQVGSAMPKGAKLSSVPQWWRKLVREWEAGHVNQAIFVAFNMNVFRTAQVSASDVMPPYMFPFCVPRARIAFDKVGSDGKRAPSKSPPQDSAIVYLPPMGDELAHGRFKRVFEAFGKVRL